MSKQLKPGGLAMLVRCLVPENNGKVVTLIKRHPEARICMADGSVQLMPAWQIDTVIPAWRGKQQSIVEERKLIPFDEPGDDAVDESKAWLPPVPTTKKEELHV